MSQNFTKSSTSLQATIGLSHAYSNTESKFSNPAVGQIEKKSDINNGILTHWLFIIDTYLRVADATNTYVKNNLFNKL